MDRKTYESLQKAVNYLYESEYRHFEENNKPKDHIMNDIMTLMEYCQVHQFTLENAEKLTWEKALSRKQEEKCFTHVWSMSYGEDDEMEKHYFVDKDNLKMYMTLTHMNERENVEDKIIEETYTADMIMQKEWTEITNYKHIIRVYELCKKADNYYQNEYWQR